MKKNIKTIDNYLNKLAEILKDNVVKINEVLVGKYILNLSKAKEIFLNKNIKRDRKEQLSESLLLIIKDIDKNILCVKQGV